MFVREDKPKDLHLVCSEKVFPIKTFVGLIHKITHKQMQDYDACIVLKLFVNRIITK